MNIVKELISLLLIFIGTAFVATGSLLPLKWCVLCDIIGVAILYLWGYYTFSTKE